MYSLETLVSGQYYLSSTGTIEDIFYYSSRFLFGGYAYRLSKWDNGLEVINLSFDNEDNLLKEIEAIMEKE